MIVHIFLDTVISIVTLIERKIGFVIATNLQYYHYLREFSVISRFVFSFGRFEHKIIGCNTSCGFCQQFVSIKWSAKASPKSVILKITDCNKQWFTMTKAAKRFISGLFVLARLRLSLKLILSTPDCTMSCLAKWRSWIDRFDIYCWVQ